MQQKIQSTLSVCGNLAFSRHLFEVHVTSLTPPFAIRPTSRRMAHAGSAGRVSKRPPGASALEHRAISMHAQAATWGSAMGGRRVRCTLSVILRCSRAARWLRAARSARCTGHMSSRATLINSNQSPLPGQNRTGQERHMLAPGQRQRGPLGAGGPHCRTGGRQQGSGQGLQGQGLQGRLARAAPNWSYYTA